MMKSILIIAFCAGMAFSQDYAGDSLAVRAILDSNGLRRVDVEDVTTVSGGRITVLTLINRGLTVIPAEIGNLTALEELYLRGNRLTSLPPEIGNLTSLTHICVGNNQITSLPDEFANLVNLTLLHLNDNELTALPDSMVNLDQLTDLRLANNGLGNLPPDVEAWADTYDPDWADTQDPPGPAVETAAMAAEPLFFLTNTPNPCVHSTDIFFNLPEKRVVSLKVYNVAGRTEGVLLEGEVRSNHNTVRLDTRDLAPGTYFYRLESDGFSRTGKIIRQR